MNNKRLLQLVLFLFMAGTIAAQQQVSLQEARMAAVNFTTARMGLRSPVGVDTVFIDRNTLEQPVLYEVVLSNGEAVLLSASKACIPILGYGYSTTGETILNATQDLPDGLNDFLTSYRAQISDCLSNRNAVLSYIGTWDSLLDLSTVPDNRNRSSVGPLLTTKWGQSYSNDSLDANAYNFYAPNSNGNCGTNNCKAGCVAVAMGQVMNYWKHPTNDNYYNMYDWCSMVDVLSIDEEYYERKRSAVAYLLNKCAEAIHMDWCVNNGCASESNPDSLCSAMAKFFYEVDTHMNLNIQENTPSWRNLLKGELNSWRPIIYRSQNNQYGHMFVCDGYSGNMFHFNWGFNGNYNGYFSIIDLNPMQMNLNYRHIAFFVRMRTDMHIDYCNLPDMPLPIYYWLYYQYAYNQWEPPYKCVPSNFFNLISASDDDNEIFRTIPEGEYSEYHAHQSVVLKSGFHAKRGSVFVAQVTPCPSCDRVRASENPDAVNHSELWDAKSIIREDDDRINPVNSQYTISPNPVQNLLYVDGDIAIGSIRIFDVTGREITTWNIDHIMGSHAMISTLNMQTGIYVLKITSIEGMNHSYKFVKQ